MFLIYLSVVKKQIMGNTQGPQYETKYYVDGETVSVSVIGHFEQYEIGDAIEEHLGTKKVSLFDLCESPNKTLTIEPVTHKYSEILNVLHNHGYVKFVR